jgi:signal transduction histidine kinase
MSENIRDKNFLLIKLTLLIVFSIYGIMNAVHETGVSVKILLLVSLYIGCLAAKEFLKGSKKIICLVISCIIVILLIWMGGRYFVPFGFLIAYEILSLFPDLDYKFYFVPLIGTLIDTPIGFLTLFVIVFMMATLYIQQNYVIKELIKRTKSDLETEQNLKKEMQYREYSAKAELNKSMLNAQNKILEDRAELSQTLHDRLGHNINGSIYQLEGVKVLMDKDPDKAGTMVQAVIDQLRTGMDEIRAILRKERPEKRKIAMLHLYELCEDCNNKGVEANLTTEGDASQVPDNLWEVILDNAYEAVSNSMKYAKCKHINIIIVVMNKMVRCTIEDDGIGCAKIEDGMGISGMRQRARSVNGMISFETEAGFKVTMLLPIAE